MRSFTASSNRTLFVLQNIYQFSVIVGSRLGFAPVAGLGSRRSRRRPFSVRRFLVRDGFVLIKRERAAGFCSNPLRPRVDRLAYQYTARFLGARISTDRLGVARSDLHHRSAISAHWSPKWGPADSAARGLRVSCSRRREDAGGPRFHCDFTENIAIDEVLAGAGVPAFLSSLCRAASTFGWQLSFNNAACLICEQASGHLEHFF